MRILFLATNYAPERTAVAPFTTGLCEHLVSKGHQVEVITAFPYYPEWKVWQEYRGLWRRREVVNRVPLHRVWHFVPRHPSRLYQRLAFDLSFMVTFFLAGLFSRSCDLIYCVSPPPVLALTAYVLSGLKRVPYVIKLTDLGSDAALSTGMLRNGPLLWSARAFERFIYSRSKAVFCLCQGFIDRLRERGSDPEKLFLIPDWGDTEQIRPMQADGSFRAAHQIPESATVLLYSGNFGKKQDLMNVVRAAELSQAQPDLLWLLIGDGEERELLEGEIRSRGLNNIKMLPLQPAAGMSQMYASVDVLLLNQRAAIEDAVIPSKLLTYMAAGRPILAAVSAKSEAARQMGKAECGLVIFPQDPLALLEAAGWLRKDSAQRQRLGAQGRDYAEKNFTKQRVLDRYDDFFNRFAERMAVDLIPTKIGPAV